jgi:hypothetical protein
MANEKPIRCARAAVLPKVRPGHRVIEEMLAKAVLRGMNAGDGVSETSQIPGTVDLQLGILAEQSVHTDLSQIEGV